MMPTIRNDSSLAFELVPDWEQLPEEWEHPDVAGVATDSHDNVHLLCRGPIPVMVYDKSGQPLHSWGEGKFTYRTHGLHIDKQDQMYIVDDHAHSVGMYTLNGELIRNIGPSNKPSVTEYDNSLPPVVTKSAGPYNRPTNVCNHPNGDLYVSDGYANSRIHRFNAEGELVQSWGEPGTGQGQFYTPHAIWCHNDGRVYVGDRQNDRIQVFSEDGVWLDEWLDVQKPQDIYIGNDGLVYVAELGWDEGDVSKRRGKITKPEPGRLSIYSSEGDLLLRWYDEDGTKPGAFIAPHGICVDSSGSIYLVEVTDTIGVSKGKVPEGSHTVQKFMRI